MVSFLKKVEQSCLTVVWYVMSKVTHTCMLVSMTARRSHHVFVLLVWFALIHYGPFCLASPETGVTFLQEYYSTHCLSALFLEIDVCVYPSLC